MEKIAVDLESLESLERISVYNNSGGYIYISDNCIYKIFLDNYFFIDEKKRNVQFLYESRWDSPKILNLLYSKGKLVGYGEELIKDAKTFKEGIGDDTLDINQKYKNIRDIFKKIRKFHNKDIYIGDIHLENFIYNADGGYIIDLDEIRFKDIDDYKFMEYYSIQKNSYSPCSIIANKNTDNIKATICALSLLYNYNFERVAKEHGTDMVEFYLSAYTNDQEFQNNIHKIFNNNSDSSSILYFDEILQEDKKCKRKEKQI